MAFLALVAANLILVEKLSTETAIPVKHPTTSLPVIPEYEGS
jgi:hypothetical protein